MNAKLSFRLHLAVWGIAVLMILGTMFSGKPAAQIAGNVIATLFWIAVYYLFYGYLCPTLLLKKKLIAFFGIAVLALLVLPFFGYTLLFLTKAIFEGDFSTLYEGYGPGMHFSGFKAMFQAGLTGSFLRMIAEYYEVKNG